MWTCGSDGGDGDSCGAWVCKGGYVCGCWWLLRLLELGAPLHARGVCHDCYLGSLYVCELSICLSVYPRACHVRLESLLAAGQCCPVCDCAVVGGGGDMAGGVGKGVSRCVSCEFRLETARPQRVWRRGVRVRGER